MLIIGNFFQDLVLQEVFGMIALMGIVMVSNLFRLPDKMHAWSAHPEMELPFYLSNDPKFLFFIQR
jgi:hypothetical protein